MNLIGILNEVIEVEQKLSDCYEKLSQMSLDESLSHELKKLSQEEIGHMNSLKAGKNYVFKEPELFGEETISDEEMKEGINLLDALLKDTENKRISLSEGLKRMYELEKRYEQVHMKTVVEIKDQSLQKLFEALSIGEKEHYQRLEKIIASL